MNRLLTFAGLLLAFTLQAWGAAQWQNISYSTNPVTYAVITNVLGFTGSATTYLRSDGTQATPAGTGAYAVTNYFITPSTGITVSTNISGTNVTWTISSTVIGGGNLTNSGASVVGMLPVYTDTTGTQVTPTNSISLDDVIAGTLSLSNMLANVVPVFDANTNMVPSSMTTNVLDLLYSQSSNLTNWGKLTTNEFLPLAGGTVTGPVLSTSPTTNGPTTLELATAGWVRSLLANGSLLYNSTNVVGTAFDASTYKYVGNEPTNGSRSYTPSAGDYIGTVMTTNRYEEVVGPIHITTYFTSSGGAASAQYTLHPEIYYTYDTNSATLLGDYASAPQAITHGAITNQYDFVVSFPPIINTNGAGNGFYIVRRFKIDTKTGTDTLKLSLGTNGVNNTSSHIAFSTPEIAGANWVASGTTNSTLAGDAQPYSVTMGGTNVIGALAGKQAASAVLDHYAGTDTNNILAAIGGAALAGATFSGNLLVGVTNIIGELASKGVGGATNVTDFSATRAAFTNILASSDNTAAHSIGISPRGGAGSMGSFSLESLESGTAGNTRGSAAVDLQIGRSVNTRVASGKNAFAWGTNNTASGDNSSAGGLLSVASGTDAFAVGNTVTANATGSAALGGYDTYAGGTYSIVLGNESKTTLYGQLAQASGQFSARGDAQGGFFTARAVMTIATSTVTNLYLDGGSQAIVLPNNTTWAFDGLVVARSTGSATGETNACYTIQGCISRDANAAATTLLWSNVTTNYTHAAASAWGPSLSANTTAGSLVITATGDTLATIRWMAYVRYVSLSE